MKKVRRENYTCVRKENQWQVGWRFEKWKVAPLKKKVLEEGTLSVSKRVNAIKFADKSEFGWPTVNKYLSDELASNPDDEEKMFPNREVSREESG